MVDSVAATTPPPYNFPPVHAVPDNSPRVDNVNNAAFINEVFQSIGQSELLGEPNDFTLTPATTQEVSDLAQVEFNDGLVNLGLPSLTVLNTIRDVGVVPDDAATVGELTPEQLQAIGVLIEDEQSLEAAASLTSPTLLSDAAATVDLSLQAQSILDAGILGAGPVGTILPALTDEQLTQIQEILQPIANEPLTQTLLAQIQAQLNARMQSPVQLSLNMLYVMMGAIGGLQAPINNTKETSVQTATPAKVTPVLPAEKAAAENSTIFHFSDL